MEKKETLKKLYDLGYTDGCNCVIEDENSAKPVGVEHVPQQGEEDPAGLLINNLEDGDIRDLFGKSDTEEWLEACLAYNTGWKEGYRDTGVPLE